MLDLLGPGAPAPVAGAVRRVSLVGLPGAGKSSVGTLLARRLGWRLADTDEMVEAAAGVSIATLFDTEGEAAFRVRELAALRRALEGDDPVVIACGGGLPTGEQARRLLLEGSTVVWLDGPDDLLVANCGDADRPLLRGDRSARMGELRRARASIYACAHLRVDVRDGDLDEICDRVADAVAGVRLGAGSVDTPPAGGGVRRLRVELGERAYDVVVGAGVLDGLAEILPGSARRVCVVTDRAVLGVARRVLAQVRAGGRQGGIVAVRGGESLKTWGRAGRLVSRFAAMRLERGDCVIAVGGGTVGDAVGFAAASYLRGLAWVQVPTTLLAMVDSALGGKTGVNLARGKNLAGAFWQPHAVVCDLEALRTLGRRPQLAAMAEVVKYAMALPAPELVTLLDTRLDALLARDPDALAEMVLRCCALKASVVAADEREAGPRAVLNYGHTAGHAIEAETGYEIPHGEAVALGMRVAGRLSVELSGCPATDIAWQDGMLAACGLGAVHRPLDPAAVLARTRTDKKARAGRPRWVLLARRGEASPGHAVEDEAALAALGAVLGR